VLMSRFGLGGDLEAHMESPSTNGRKTTWGPRIKSVAEDAPQNMRRKLVLRSAHDIPQTE